ncbi:hypothetical protein RCJ22_14940, partial [Vibrio sp. FNV 38]|nr:hypothetical protein [Vibrio sp. FNV 38]
MKHCLLFPLVITVCVGCASTNDTQATTNTINNSEVAPHHIQQDFEFDPDVIISRNHVADPQFEQFWSSSAKAVVWIKLADKESGKGDVGSSKESAFNQQGSARIRFLKPTDDFTYQPALAQTVNGLLVNTDYMM